MERREYEVTRQCRLNRNRGGLVISDFTHHDHVGILTQQRLQGAGKRHIDQ